jgi:hypothetical protein
MTQTGSIDRTCTKGSPGSDGTSLGLDRSTASRSQASTQLPSRAAGMELFPVFFILVI